MSQVLNENIYHTFALLKKQNCGKVQSGRKSVEQNVEIVGMYQN